MLDFIKKIFIEEAEEKETIIEINIYSLADWLKEKSKPIKEDIRRETDDVLMRISEELQRTRFNIDALEGARLQNPNIPFKAKQYMEGNRAAYIKSVSSFLGHMEINNKEYYYLLEFCKTFEELLGELHASTLRSYTILQEFFANESGKIAENIRNFDLLFKELKMTLNDIKITKSNSAIEKAKLLESKAKQKINIDVDLKNAEASMMISINEKESIMASIEAFNGSEEYSSFGALNEEKKLKSAELTRVQDGFSQLFSSLERPLRKYSHIAFQHEELVIDYLKDPVLALSVDRQFEILNVMANMERMLAENEIIADDRKKEKYIEDIKRFSREMLQDMLKMCNALKSEVSDLDAKAKETGVADKIREFNRQLSEINQRIERNTEEHAKLENDAARLNESINSSIIELQDTIKEAFNEKVRVKI